MSEAEPFELARPPVSPAELVVDLEGYEGPIDMLLTLAREQKVDLTRISITQLADQYLAFITAARRLRLEIAADYLVMAAWLAYLKSRLLLPEPAPPDEPSGAELAAALTHQLQRLEAMQQAGARLMARPQLGRDVYGRGAPEGLPRVLKPIYEVSLYDLLRAYGDQRQRKEGQVLHIEAPELYSMDDALQRLEPHPRPRARLAQPLELSAARPARRVGRALGRRRHLRREPGAGALRQAAATPGQRLRPDLYPQPAGDPMNDGTSDETIDSPLPDDTDQRADQLRLLEALLFASAAPLDEESIALRLPQGSDIPALVAELGAHYSARGVNLVRIAGGWTLRTAPDLGPRLKLEQTVTRKLSRAAIETLAIVAYHQPVTRGEIEEIRGVIVSGGTLDVLMEAGWITPKGRRETPGRPVTWVTTDQFLAHFGLADRRDLPGIEELKAAGLIGPRPDFVLSEQAVPSEAVSAAEEDQEEPLFDPESNAEH